MSVDGRRAGAGGHLLAPLDEAGVTLSVRDAVTRALFWWQASKRRSVAAIVAWSPVR
jgi:hypothetical protein